MRPIYFVLPIAAAFSGGGGSGETDSGAPIQQSCDAIGVCALPDEDGSLKCPDGMHKVAPPVRSEVYVLATEAGGTTYVPGELVPLTLTVTQRQILGMVDKGRGNTTLESAKYIGLLLYAVREGDAREQKIGSLGDPAPGPAALLDAARPELRRQGRHAPLVVAQVVCRAVPLPRAGRDERRQPHLPRPRQAGRHQRRRLLLAGRRRRAAVGGQSRRRLDAREAPPPPADAVTWRRAGDGQTCAQACADASLVCDETALGAVQSAPAFQEAVDGQHVCRLPLLASCDGPSASRMVDGFCWYLRPSARRRRATRRRRARARSARASVRACRRAAARSRSRSKSSRRWRRRQ